MGLTLTETHHVSYYECDYHQQMTLPMLISVAVKTSITQINKLNIHHPNILKELNLGWVITNYDIHIQRLPKQDEMIFVTTHADDYNKFFCYRDFYIHDQEGNELVKINSIFVLMNLTTRKIVSVPKEVISVYQSQKTTKVRRFPEIPQLLGTHQKEYHVRYFDLDGNGHVNNANYFTWFLDSLPFEWLSTKIPNHIVVKFNKEVEYGETITSQYETNDNTTIHQIINNNQITAEAYIEWMDKSCQ